MEKMKIGIIGLGYVGLPLARLFATKYNVIGYDINKIRVNEINNAIDSTNEVKTELLHEVLKSNGESENGLYCSSKEKDLTNCNIFIITVPTPVDKNNRPVFKPLKKASSLVGRYLKPNDIVIYESTVYPGATEEICIPILEKYSNLSFNKDFFVGYSPERINPGDKEHTVDKILKVTSGSNEKTAKKIDDLYKSVITAGTFLATSIKVAEAAKVIENSQRDINIAFVNELAKIFNLMNINTNDVLEAANTKWNFLPFKPGLVGGHCIGVDPYYLAEKAQEFSYHPEIILSGRRLNDGMPNFISKEIIKLMIKKNIPIKDSNLLILGITFKENCPDIRNSKVANLAHSLKDYGINIDIYDPWADPNEVESEFDLISDKKINKKKYEVIVLAVSHNEFLNIEIKNYLSKTSVVYDIKNFLDKNIVDKTL